MIRNFINQNQIEYYENANLKRYNTYRLETICKYLVFPKNKEELRILIKELSKNEEKYLVLGNGSNVIFKNAYYDGVIILLNKLNNLTITGEILQVGAGYSLPKLAIETANRGLTGLEFASGIPGFVGASIAMNAGAYNSSMSEVIETVEVLDKNFEFITIKKEDLDFQYRSSIFKKEPKYIIVSATIRLATGDKEEILKKMTKRRLKRFESQPLDKPSAGSIFRNPEGFHSGELIEKSGLKGYSIGGAQVSEKHANFIVNNGNATGKEIVELIQKVKETVKQKYNVDLILEQIIID